MSTCSLLGRSDLFREGARLSRILADEIGQFIGAAIAPLRDKMLLQIAARDIGQLTDLLEPGWARPPSLPPWWPPTRTRAAESASADTTNPGPRPAGCLAGSHRGGSYCCRRPTAPYSAATSAAMITTRTCGQEEHHVDSVQPENGHAEPARPFMVAVVTLAPIDSSTTATRLPVSTGARSFYAAAVAGSLRRAETMIVWFFG